MIESELACVPYFEPTSHLVEIAHFCKYHAILEPLHVIPRLLDDGWIGWPFILVIARQSLALEDTLGKFVELFGGLRFGSPDLDYGDSLKRWLNTERLKFPSQVAQSAKLTSKRR